MEKCYRYYKHYIDDKRGGNVTFVNTLDAEHSWPTQTYGNICPYKGSPYINACNYSAPEHFLAHFMWPDSLVAPGQPNVEINLLPFSQALYTPALVSPHEISLGDAGS